MDWDPFDHSCYYLFLLDSSKGVCADLLLGGRIQSPTCHDLLKNCAHTPEPLSFYLIGVP